MKNYFYILLLTLIFTGYSFPQDIWINEFSYDCAIDIQSGEDDGDEFIEIVAPVGRDMSQYAIVFFNYREDNIYYAYDYFRLDGIVSQTNSNAGKGFFVIKTNRSSLLEDYTPISGGITVQTIYSNDGLWDNQAGIMLVNNEDGSIIHAVFYELPVTENLPDYVYSKLNPETDWASSDFEMSSSFSDRICLPLEDGETSNPCGSISMIGDGFSRIWISTSGEIPNSSTPGNLNYDQGSLPVELSSFTANVIKSEIKLNWRTESEVDNYGFEIERISNVKGQTSDVWEKISFINGNGNSNSPKNYSFEDNNLTDGKYQYRLKQIDSDGSYNFSNIVEVIFTNILDYSLSQNYPNPFNPNTKISFTLPEAGKVKLVVYNLLGQKVKILFDGYKEPGAHTFNFDAKDLNSGVYIYKIEANNFTQTRKMTLLK
jgi:hypothetical protein